MNDLSRPWKVCNYAMNLAILAIAALAAGKLPAGQPCAIEVVEKGSGWPVPLVELADDAQRAFCDRQCRA